MQSAPKSCIEPSRSSHRAQDWENWGGGRWVAAARSPGVGYNKGSCGVLLGCKQKGVYYKGNDF